MALLVLDGLSHIFGHELAVDWSIMALAEVYSISALLSIPHSPAISLGQVLMVKEEEIK